MASIDATHINTGKGETTIFNAQLTYRGVYALEFDIRSTVDNPLAQMPLTVFQGQKIVKILTMTGADTQWQRVHVDLDVMYMKNSFFRFYIGQAGLEFKEVQLKLVENWEDRLG